MEIKEAIKIINQYDMNFHWNDGEPIPAEQLAEAFDLAISALEKQEPMKPLPQEMDIDGRAITPCGFCGEELPHNSLYDFCPYCGQAIDRRKDG